MLRRFRALAQRLRQGADSTIRSEPLLRQLLQIQLLQSLTRTPCFQDPRRLLSSGYKVMQSSGTSSVFAVTIPN